MAPPIELREFYQEPERLPFRQRMWKGFMTNPAAFVGAGGFVGMVSYAAYNFKNRKSSASMYVMHYRVVAQFMFIGALGIGVGGLVAYSMIMGDPRLREKKDAEKKDQ